MKVHLFYLSLPDNLRNYYPDYMVDDFNHVKDILYDLSRFENDNSDRSYYLYAITDDNELADMFEQFHDMNIFTRITKKMSKDEYEMLLDSNKNSKLKRHNLNHDINTNSKYIKKFDIICTNAEIKCIEETFSEYLDNIIYDCTLIEYSQFKDKYIKALDILLYCTYNKINTTDEDDFYGYQLSFGCTAESYVSGQVFKYPNKISLYLKLFKLLLWKDR